MTLHIVNQLVFDFLLARVCGKVETADFITY